MKRTTNQREAQAALVRSLGGQWAMDETRVRELHRCATSATLAADGMADGGVLVATDYTVDGGVARIDVVGVLTKYETWYDEALGFCPASALQSAAGRAFDDPAVRSIALVIDSPGGLVAGTVQLAEFFRRRADETGKSTLAIISDCGASSAYWIAAACDAISCNASGAVGSIGVCEIWPDDSAFWASLGITHTVVSSGGIKGHGLDGKITPELLEESKRSVMATYEQFVAWVADRRGLSNEEALAVADGRCWVASEALGKRLIDRIEPLDAAMAAERERIANMDREQFTKYAAENPNDLQAVMQPHIDKAVAATKPKNATMAELKEAFPDDKDYVWERMNVEAPMAEHKLAYVDHARAQMAKTLQANDQLKQELAKVDPSKAGSSSALNTGGSSGERGEGEKKPDPARMASYRQMAGLPTKK